MLVSSSDKMKLLLYIGVLAMSIHSLVLTWPLRHIHDITTIRTALHCIDSVLSRAVTKSDRVAQHLFEASSSSLMPKTSVLPIPIYMLIIPICDVIEGRYTNIVQIQ